MKTKKHIKSNKSHEKIGDVIPERRAKRIQDARSKKTSYMSNTKWRKFFSLLKDHNIGYYQAKWKLLGSTEWYETWGLGGNNLGDYRDDTTSDGIGGPIKYLEIEQIKIPQKFVQSYPGESLRTIKQDIEVLEKLLREHGKFEIEVDSEELTIFGYR